MSAVEALDSRTHRRSYDRLQVARVFVSRWELQRPDHVEMASWPYLAISTLTGSATVVHGERTLQLAEGDVCVIRNDAALRVASEPGSDLLVMRIPEGSVGPHSQVLAAADGYIWATRNGTASLVAHLLQGLAAQFDDYVPGNPGRLAEHIVGLLVLMCADARLTDTTSHGALLVKAKEYIEAHLGEIDLSPDRIAASQNVSTRTLHRLFESEGFTIGGWIRSRRLEHCRLDLVDRNADAGSVSGIGARWGLWDAAHFSRLFKTAYGLSPRAYRVTHTSHACGEDCATMGALVR
ncbi:MAG: AraC family transcriptional regulator [Rhodoglobus sp.]|jgi:AraC-like DNA-binding protein|nr:AraC family transcriptional regulator [Rhodoglobus sp.]